MSAAPSTPPEECAVCGAAIPRRAKACPECGADERTGWRETSVYDGLDLPSGAYDDDALPTKPAIRERRWLTLAVGVLTLLALIALLLGYR